ncbi:hypothetical protein QTP88_021916 [Uroleucon formosanum]
MTTVCFDRDVEGERVGILQKCLVFRLEMSGQGRYRGFGSGERKDIFTAGVVGTCDRISRGWGGRAAAGAAATAVAAAAAFAATAAAVPMVDYFRNSSASSSTLRRVYNEAPHH